MIQVSQPDFKTVTKAVEISLNVSSSNLLFVRILNHFRQMKPKDYQQGRVNIDHVIIYGIHNIGREKNS